MSVRYATGLLLDVMRLVLVFVLGVEAIFLTDLVISHILPHVLDNRASLLNVVVLMLLSMPSGLYIALPIAVLAASYFVILRRREAREFIVLAGMGRGAGPMVRFVLCVGVAGLALSLFLSGYVEPLSRYSAGMTMFDVRLEAIRSGSIGAGKFYQVSGYTVFAGSGQTNQLASKVFFLQDRGEDRYRLVTATQSLRLDAPAMTRAGVVLHNAAAYDFDIGRLDASGAATGGECVGCMLRSILPGGARASSEILVDLPNPDFPEIAPRGGQVEERTSPELLDGDQTDGGVIRELCDRLMRGLLVFIAPLLALLAVALTRPASVLLALPAAAGLLLAGSFFGPGLLEDLLPLGLAGIAQSLVAIALGLSGLVIALVFRFEKGCIQHGGVQL